MAHLVRSDAIAFGALLQTRLAYTRRLPGGHWAFLCILVERDGLTALLSVRAGVMEPTTIRTQRWESLRYRAPSKSQG